MSTTPDERQNVSEHIETRQPWEAPTLTVMDTARTTQGADPSLGLEGFGYTPPSS